MTRSALLITTVPVTLEAFLTPFADRFRSVGWRVDALANGATANPRIAEHFDERFDIAWSRNPLDPRNLAGSSAELRALVRRERYDIVHVHTPVAAFVTRYALRSIPRAERPVVIYTAHGFHFYCGQDPVRHAVFRSIERLAAPWTDFLVTINGEDYEAAGELGGIAPERVRLIPGIGVDTERFSPDAASPSEIAAVRAGLRVPRDAFMLAMVAEFAPVKRHEHLLAALAKVRDERVMAVFVGDGPLESTLREKMVAHGLSDRVRWAGYRRDVPAVLAASDALALVSEREGLARSVLEAMATGKPVIGTRTRGIADAVGPDAGWLVDKEDADALAAAIDEAASDPAECAARGAAARQRVFDEFALPAIITAYEELYDEALASRV